MLSEGIERDQWHEMGETNVKRWWLKVSLVSDLRYLKTLFSGLQKEHP